MSMGGHHNPVALKDEWLTPPSILEALGAFDLDPCSPVTRPWDTAERHLTIEDDGLAADWQGRVWCNPPYGRATGVWLNKLAEHGQGIALIFARTETQMFFDEVWEKATALFFFFRGRLHFHHVNGDRAPANAGAPSVLIAYGDIDANKLEECELTGILRGQFLRLKTLK